MARIHGCHVTSREAMLFMKYEHFGKCKGSFKDSQRKCKYWHMNATYGGANLHPGVNLLPGANLHPGANCAHEHGLRQYQILSSGLVYLERNGTYKFLKKIGDAKLFLSSI